MTELGPYRGAYRIVYRVLQPLLPIPTPPFRRPVRRPVVLRNGSENQPSILRGAVHSWDLIVLFKHPRQFMGVPDSSWAVIEGDWL